MSRTTRACIALAAAAFVAAWPLGGIAAASHSGSIAAGVPSHRASPAADAVADTARGSRALAEAPAGDAAENSHAPASRDATEVERALLDAGLENVSVRPGGGVAVSYENRRYRRSVEALARARAAAGERIVAGERRLGLLVAALEPPEDEASSFRVRFPSDPDFPETPAGPMRSTTFRRADLDVGALVDYRVGNIHNPFQARAQLDLRLLLNPWPGARTRVGVAFPLQSDFPVDQLAADADRIRLSQASLDQFGWIRRGALYSVSGGYFGDNRWGVSAGAARPLRGGTWLLDVQVDRTGFLALTEEGTLYSTPDRTSGFAGVTYRPPLLDLALKARAVQFLYGDRGVELEMRRSFDDVDVAYFVQSTDGLEIFGVRLDLPIPPMTRASGSALRVQPAPRFGLQFRDQDLTFGTHVGGVASREDYLRQLNRTSLEDGRAQYRSALGRPGARRAADAAEWVSFSGMSGFIHTPWAGVLADRGLEVGYGLIPREWAYDHRGTNDNQVFYTTLGFLPRLETSLRWTRIPGYHSFEEFAPDSRLVDMDRMASARLALFEPRPGRPGLSLGVEDAQGQRRFHAAYAVAGLPFTVAGRAARASAGYGFRVFEAARYTLDGAFAAAELSPWSWLRTQVEYDTEKWNVGVGLSPVSGLKLRAALLNLESPSIGAGWSHSM